MVDKKLIEDRLNTWLQILAIILAGSWAVYTFFYKEVWIPSNTPTTVTLDLSIEPATTSQHPLHGLTPMLFRASVTNLSTRNLHALPSAWIIQGYRIKKKTGFDFENAEAALKAQQLRMEARYFENTEIEVIAVGRLFSDTILAPNEEVERSSIVYVPSGTYDMLELGVIVPTVTSKRGLKAMQWEIKNAGKKGATLTLKASKELAEKEKNKYGELLERRGFYLSTGMSRIALEGQMGTDHH